MKSIDNSISSWVGINDAKAIEPVRGGCLKIVKENMPEKLDDVKNGFEKLAKKCRISIKV